MSKYDWESQRRWEDEPFHYIAQSVIMHFCNRKTGNIYSLDCSCMILLIFFFFRFEGTFKDIIMAGRDVDPTRCYCGYYGDEFERNMNSGRS